VVGAFTAAVGAQAARINNARLAGHMRLSER
jgi:hypothetical protein